MASLIKDLKNDGLFKNNKSVQKSTEQRNRLFDSIIDQLKALIDEYNMREKDLLKPEQILSDDPTISRIKFKVDTANSKAAVVKNNVITVQTWAGGWQPVFACEQLITG